ncbi:MAG TPA: hypothetical protein EYQ60_13790 [Myxococcales bacterium]|nr:hypothetical protein [Myxococcales bacterium]HIK85313.1 hypothetical protein [Myxococcales bacterium]
MTDRTFAADGESGMAVRKLDFFDEMVWPVPLSFAGAISAMRFEQGDVLYRDKAAYCALEGAIPHGLSAIQVLLPQRSTRGLGSEVPGDRRQSNWRSEVTVELIDLEKGRSEVRVLSQGKLATALFTGDEAWLDTGREEPPLPASARDLQPRLEDSVGRFRGLSKTKKGSRFIFVVDLAGDASRSKASNVEAALRASGSVERIDLSPAEAGIEDPGRFHPALIVRGLAMAKRASHQVLPILRQCLYAGGSGTAPESDQASDRFSIGRHGILQNLD